MAWLRERKNWLLIALALLLTGIAGTTAFTSIMLHRGRPDWQWGTDGRFFKSEAGAVFPEMFSEPPHNVYGSAVTAWIYRWENGTIAEVIVTGHAESKVCIPASIQLYETALSLNPRAEDLLAAGTGRFLGVTPQRRAVLEQDPAVEEYRSLQDERSNLYSKLFLQQERLRLLPEETKEKVNQEIAELERQMKQANSKLQEISQKGVVREYLRPQRLEQLVASLRQLEVETGLVNVVDGLEASLLSDTRRAVEERVVLGQHFPEHPVLISQLRLLGAQQHAIFLPFYYTSSPAGGQSSKASLPYLVIELDADELTIPQSVLESHLDALVEEAKRDVQRRKEFYEKELWEAEKTKAELESLIDTGRMSPDELIYITNRVNLEEARIESLSEPIPVSLREYLAAHLPMLIEKTSLYLEEAERVLSDLEEAAKPEGALSKINQGILLDSFLRKWDLVFLDSKQGQAYEDWLRDQRQRVWSRIDQKLKDSGINPEVLKQENVVFDVSLVGNRWRIIPYYIANGDFTLVIDPRNGIIRYVHYWGLRQMVLKEELPQVVQELLTEGRKLEKANKLEKARRKYQAARTELAEPLREAGWGAFRKGDFQKARSELREALTLDPRGTSAWLIGKWRERQKDTHQTFGERKDSYSEYSRDLEFLDRFEKAMRYLFQGEYRKAVKELQAAYKLNPGIPDPLVWLALTAWHSGDEEQGSEWFNKARQMNSDFIEAFIEAGRTDKPFPRSDEFEQVERKVQELEERERREAQVIQAIEQGDRYLENGEPLEALWEYEEAVRLNVEFNEPYQRLVDLYWELGMYRRAFEVALLQLEDVYFGLTVKTKPLRIANNRLSFDVLNDMSGEPLELGVQREAKSLTVWARLRESPEKRVNILRITSTQEDDIQFLADYLEENVGIQALSPVGETVADRLLNSKVPRFPAEDILVREIFSQEQLGTLLLKAMVYGGIEPGFVVAPTEAEDDACTHGPDSLIRVPAESLARKSLLGTRDYLYETFYETDQIVAAIRYPIDTEAQRKIAQDIRDFYNLDWGREVVSLEATPDTVVFQIYPGRSRWQRLWEKLTGRRPQLPRPETVSLPREISPRRVAEILVSSNLGDLAFDASVVDDIVKMDVLLRRSWSESLPTDEQFALYSYPAGDKLVFVLLSKDDVKKVEVTFDQVLGVVDRIRNAFSFLPFITPVDMLTALKRNPQRLREIFASQNALPERGILLVAGGHIRDVNYHKVFPNVRVLRTPDVDVDRMLTNIQTLLDTRMGREDTVIINGVPRADPNELANVGIDQSPEVWKGVWEKWNGVYTKHNITYMGRTGRAVEAALKKSPNVIIIVAHGNGQAVFFPEGSKLSVDKLKDIEKEIRQNGPTVVLFSCEAAKMEEDFTSFAEALINVGARGVIAPSHEIEADSRLLDRFLYYSLQEGKGILEALHEATRDLSIEEFEYLVLRDIENKIAPKSVSEIPAPTGFLLKPDGRRRRVIALSKTFHTA